MDFFHTFRVSLFNTNNSIRQAANLLSTLPTHYSTHCPSKVHVFDDIMNKAVFTCPSIHLRLATHGLNQTDYAFMLLRFHTPITEVLTQGGWKVPLRLRHSFIYADNKTKLWGCSQINENYLLGVQILDIRFKVEILRLAPRFRQIPNMTFLTLPKQCNLRHQRPLIAIVKHYLF